MFGFFRRNKQDAREKTQEAVKKSREGLFSFLKGVFGTPRLDEKIWETLEEALISADVGVEATQNIVSSIRRRATESKVSSTQEVMGLLKDELIKALGDGSTASPLLDDEANWPKPVVILVIGVNGVGKTTSIAKLAHRFIKEGKAVVLGAGDTFRAAAIEQLQLHAQRIGAEMVAHKQGADPGAVAFDAYNAAKARSADVVIIDTAGRLHTKHNLMEELKKIERVIKRLDPSAPHAILLVLDATTGQNGLAQASYFTGAVPCAGVFLAKLDGTARGGIVVAIRKQLGLPILFVGTGEKMDDMAPFDAEEFVEALLAPQSQS